MLSAIRARLNALPPAISVSAAFVVLAGAGVGIYFNLRPDRPPPDSPLAEIVYRKCTHAPCGHVVEDTRFNLIRKHYMPFEGDDGPFGEGRKCPKCGQPTLRFATRSANGEYAIVEPKPMPGER